MLRPKKGSPPIIHVVFEEKQRLEKLIEMHPLTTEQKKRVDDSIYVCNTMLQGVHAYLEESEDERD